MGANDPYVFFFISGYFIDQGENYGMGFVMAGVSLIVSALFLLLLHQMTRRGQGSTAKSHDMHTDTMGRSLGGDEVKEPGVK